MPAVRWLPGWSTRDFTCALDSLPLVPDQMTVVFGLGMRLRVRMHTTLEKASYYGTPFVTKIPSLQVGL